MPSSETLRPTFNDKFLQQVSQIAPEKPRDRWKVLTSLGAMSLRGMEAILTVASVTDGEVFLTYLVLEKTLRVSVDHEVACC